MYTIKSNEKNAPIEGEKKKPRHKELVAIT